MNKFDKLYHKIISESAESDGLPDPIPLRSTKERDENYHPIVPRPKLTKKEIDDLGGPWNFNEYKIFDDILKTGIMKKGWFGVYSNKKVNDEIIKVELLRHQDQRGRLILNVNDMGYRLSSFWVPVWNWKGMPGGTESLLQIWDEFIEMFKTDAAKRNYIESWLSWGHHREQPKENQEKSYQNAVQAVYEVRKDIEGSGL